MNNRHTAATRIALAALLGFSMAATAADNDPTTRNNDSQASSQSDSQTAQPQGVYSTDRLIGTDVYAQGNSEDRVGEISDILLDNNMQISAFVVSDKGRLNLGGGKSFVVQPGDISIDTTQTEEPSKPEYQATLGVTRDDLSGFPVYNDSWYSNAQTKAGNAWEQTKDAAGSAWTDIKQTTSDIVNNPREDADGSVDDNTADSMQNNSNSQ